jgi:hypothetical protein
MFQHFLIEGRRSLGRNTHGGGGHRIEPNNKKRKQNSQHKRSNERRLRWIAKQKKIKTKLFLPNRVLVIKGSLPHRLFTTQHIFKPSFFLFCIGTKRKLRHDLFSLCLNKPLLLSPFAFLRICLLSETLGAEIESSFIHVCIQCAKKNS